MEQEVGPEQQNALEEVTPTDGVDIANDELVTENQLSLTFTDVSWVDIRDGDGNRLAFKNYVQGEDLTVTSTTPMQVFLGNAEAVAATFNGVPYDIKKSSDAVFARFVVGE